ncbi:TPA: hypothetical protein PFG44_002718 [Staphylococcus aureus]|nr:hypothetical protein [Staphylococcus aureus]
MGVIFAVPLAIFEAPLRMISFVPLTIAEAPDATGEPSDQPPKLAALACVIKLK